MLLLFFCYFALFFNATFGQLITIQVVSCIDGNSVAGVTVIYDGLPYNTNASGYASFQKGGVNAFTLAQGSYIQRTLEHNPQKQKYCIFPEYNELYTIYGQPTDKNVLLTLVEWWAEPILNPGFEIIGRICKAQMGVDSSCQDEDQITFASSPPQSKFTTFITFINTDKYFKLHGAVSNTYNGQYITSAVDMDITIYPGFGLSFEDDWDDAVTVSGSRIANNTNEAFLVFSIDNCKEGNHLISFKYETLTNQQLQDLRTPCFDNTVAVVSTVIVICVVAIIIITVIIGLVVRAYRRRKARASSKKVLKEVNYQKRVEDGTRTNYQEIGVSNKNSAVEVELSLKHSSTVSAIPIITDVQVMEKLSEGNFGEVYKGKWNRSTVALKTLKAEDLSSFEKEAAILFQLGSHPHVVQFYGLYTTPKNEIFIVMEFMSKGTLLNVLREEGETFKESDLLELIMGGCSGMAFLEHKKILHRDLACRNLLVSKVDDQYRVKVSDFGLARGLDDEEYYKPSTNTNVPVRWSAPEVLQQRGYFPASDVWSFGITCWEILELGKKPFGWMSNKDVYINVPKGERLPKPDICSDELWKVIEECFHHDHKKRPTFQKLLIEFQSAMEGIKRRETAKREKTISILHLDTNYLVIDKSPNI